MLQQLSLYHRDLPHCEQEARTACRVGRRGGDAHWRQAHQHWARADCPCQEILLLFLIVMLAPACVCRCPAAVTTFDTHLASVARGCQGKHQYAASGRRGCINTTAAGTDSGLQASRCTIIIITRPTPAWLVGSTGTGCWTPLLLSHWLADAKTSAAALTKSQTQAAPLPKVGACAALHCAACPCGTTAVLG